MKAIEITFWILLIVGVFMTVFDVNAQVPSGSERSGAAVMCSKTSIGLSIQWTTKETAKAKALHESLGPRPEKADYFTGQRYREEMLIWLAEQQLAATANQSAIAANHAMESLILDCEMLKRLGLGA